MLGFRSPALLRLIETSPRCVQRFRVTQTASNSLHCRTWNLRLLARMPSRASCSFSDKISDGIDDSDGSAQAEGKPTKRKRRKKKPVIEQELLGPLFPFEGNTDGQLHVQSPSAQQQFTIDRITRKGRRSYHIRLDDGTSYHFPSVTTILEETQPISRRFMLHNWAKGLIKEHGKSGFDKIKQDIKNSGTLFHQQLENKLLEISNNVPFSIKSRKQLEQEKKVVKEMHQQPATATPSTSAAIPTAAIPTAATGNSTSIVQREQQEDFSEESSAYFQSIAHILKDITDVFALESVVAHIELGYTGTFDCVAKYKGELCLIDWKTSTKPKPSLEDCYDFPLQTAAYAGAINQNLCYPFKVYSALIVVAYATGDPGHCHFLSHEDCLEHWHKWVLRLEQYQTQFADDLSEIYV